MIKKSGYIEKIIDGELISFKFGMGAFAKFCEMQNITLDKMGEILQPSSPSQLMATINLFYSAAFIGMKSQGKDVTFTPEAVSEWIDEMDQNDFNDIMETMTKARIMGKGIDEVEKKRQTKKK